jgi:DNA polymerase III subunit delta
MSAEFKQIVKDIQQQQFAPIYVLDGEEPFFIDHICELLEQKVVQPQERDFNQRIMYGKETTWSDVVSECRRYPMFAERQLVILKEAQTLKDFDQLEAYVQNPLQSTVFVIAYKYKKLDQRKAFTKLLKKQGVCFTAEPVKEKDLPQWIIDFGKSTQLHIEMPIALLIASYLGTDLQKTINEIQKVAINLPPGSTLTAQHVEQYIGISKDYNSFELADALLKRDLNKVYKVIHYAIANPKEMPLPALLAALYTKYSQLFGYYSVAKLPDKEAAVALKTAPFFMNDLRQKSKHFSYAQVSKAMLALYQASRASVGMQGNQSYESTLKDLIAQLIYL